MVGQATKFACLYFVLMLKLCRNERTTSTVAAGTKLAGILTDEVRHKVISREATENWFGGLPDPPRMLIRLQNYQVTLKIFLQHTRLR